MKGIAGKRVFISAAAGGIGLVMAHRFLQAGARVHVCDVDEAALAQLDGSTDRLPASTPMWPTQGRWKRFFKLSHMNWAGWMCW